MTVNPLGLNALGGIRTQKGICAKVHEQEGFLVMRPNWEYRVRYFGFFSALIGGQRVNNGAHCGGQ